MNASEASNAVSVANVPPEIREQLSTWLDEQEVASPTLNHGAVDGHSILAKATDDNGIVTIESLKIALSQLNLGIDPEIFAEQACAEGELLQDGLNRWKRP